MTQTLTLLLPLVSCSGSFSSPVAYLTMLGSSSACMGNAFEQPIERKKVTSSHTFALCSDASIYREIHFRREMQGSQLDIYSYVKQQSWCSQCQREEEEGRRNKNKNKYIQYIHHVKYQLEGEEHSGICGFWLTFEEDRQRLDNHVSGGLARDVQNLGQERAHERVCVKESKLQQI